MPLMTHRDSGQTRIVPGRSRSSYEQRGWKIADASDVAPVGQDDTVDDGDGRPNVNDPKSDWVAWAEQVGVDPDGLTKAELIDACDGA